MTRVLLVDDSLYVRTMLESLLEGEFEVVGTATNGAEAVHLFKEHGPDVVLMDILMPQVDGERATTEIKKLDPSATVIVVTGVRQPRKRDALLEAGADAYLTKPFDPGELLEQVRLATDESVSA